MNEKKYQLGDLRVLGTVLVSSAIIFGIGAYILKEVGTQVSSNINASKVVNFGQDALVSTSQFFVIIGLGVVASVVIGLISRAM